MQSNQRGSLQNKFEGFGAAPSELMWNSIAANLDQDEKKKGIIWWWIIGAAASITLLIGIYQLGYTNGVQEKAIATKQPNSIPAENQTTNSTNDKNLSGFTKNESIDETNTTISVTNSENNLFDKNKNQVADNNKNQKISDLKVNNNSLRRKEIKGIDATNNTTRVSLINEKELVNRIEKLPLALTQPISRQLITPSDLSKNLITIEKPEQQNNWEIGFNIGSNFPRNSSKNYLPPPSNSLTSADMQTESYVAGTQTAGFSVAPPQNLVITRPLTVEFTASKKLGKRWRFQTGLTTTLFRGKNAYNSTDLITTKANYIGLGIPVHFNFDILQRKRLFWYAGVGVNTDLPIFETVKSSYATYLAENNTQRKFTFGYMGSTQINTGIRYAINEKMDLNVNPYFRYYFAQSVKSSVPLLKQNIWLGASVGLVWKL